MRSFGDVFPLYVERNVLASQRVFEAAALAGARVVFASSSSVYGEAEQYPTPEETPPRPLSPYGITKLACEHLARASGRSFGLDAVVLRYFNAYGPRQRPDMAFPRVVDALIEGRPFTLYGDGEQSRSFTYVGDVVAASMLAMEEAGSGTTYNVGGGQEATMNETIAMLETHRRAATRRTAGRGDRGRSAPDEGGHDADQERPRLAADYVPGRRPQGAVGVGGGRVARVNTPSDLGAEQELDLRSVWERIAARWWLPVLGIVLGLVVGFALALGGGKVYEAETLVAMGQPFSPNGGAPVQSFLTNPRAVSEIIRSESALRKAANAADLRVRSLRGKVSTTTVGASGPGARPTGAPLVTIKVIAAQPRKAERAADSLAKEVIARTSAQYVDTKIRAFNEQLDSIQDSLNTLAPRIAAAEQAVNEPGLGSLDKLVVLSALDNAQARRGQLLDLQSDVQQQLALAENVEKAQVVEPAAAAKTTARSGRNGALVGGLIGLLLGCAAALLADPFLARRARTA